MLLYGLSTHFVSLSKVVQDECVKFLTCDSEAIQTSGDPSSFQNTRPGLHAVDTSKLLSTKITVVARTSMEDSFWKERKAKPKETTVTTVKNDAQMMLMAGQNL